jgi:outer membrane protein assembly factor BamB
MKRIIIAALLLLPLFYMWSQDVAQWRGPNRSGIYEEKGLLNKWPESGPKLLWYYNGLGEGHTSAAVTAEGVFTTGMADGKGYVFAFDHSGRLLWKSEYGPEWNVNYSGTRSTPHITGKKLYLMSGQGKLVCMDCSNGLMIWSVDLVKEYGARNLSYGMAENLLTDGNILYCTPGGINAGMVALDRNTGRLLWKCRINGEKSAYCSPIIIKIQDKKIIITIMENSVCAVNATTGSLLWTHKFENTYSVHPNIPLYMNGMLFCTAELGVGGMMLRISDDGSSVKEVWTSQMLDPVCGGVVALNGRLYGTGYSDYKLTCLDWNTGKEIYAVRTLAPGSIIANDGLLYVYSEQGKIGLVEPGSSGFVIVSTFNVPMGSGPHWAHPVIHNKRLYIRHGNALMVYDIAKTQ